MGMSSKQVSGEGFQWGESLIQSGALEVPKVTPVRQRQQQSGPPLKCPRCESTNTKFCYFNNYNPSQPRHFCKACKRHWTKGGTLRDVPVGGGRRNKRLKTQSQKQTKLPLKLHEEKKFHDVLYQPFFHPTSSLQPLSQSGLVKNSLIASAESMHSVIPLPNLLPTTDFSSFNYTPFGLSRALNYFDEAKLSEDLITRTSTSTVTTMTPMPSSTIDTSSYWNLDDFKTFIWTDAKEPGDDPLE